MIRKLRQERPVLLLLSRTNIEAQRLPGSCVRGPFAGAERVAPDGASRIVLGSALLQTGAS